VTEISKKLRGGGDEQKKDTKKNNSKIKKIGKGG